MNPAEQGARDVAELTNEPLPGTDPHRDRKAGLRYAIPRSGYSRAVPGPVVEPESPTIGSLMRTLEASLAAARQARRDETAAG